MSPVLWGALAVSIAQLGNAPVVLDGVVRELGTRDPIPGATVECNGKTTETDGQGHFTLELPIGRTVVRVAASGYKPREFSESEEPGTKLEVIYRLEPTGNAYRTTVTGEKFRSEAARVQLSTRELQESAGSSGDPLRALMRLPGIASIASGLAYPVVRGTQPAATAYFVDGVRVPQLFHSMAAISVLHPDFIEKISFYPGLPPVQYGRLLAGAVDATAARPRDGRFHATASLDLINASAYLEVPIDATGTAVSAAGRVSYTPIIAGPVTRAVLSAIGPYDRTPVANFWDYQVRAEQRLGPVKLRALVFGSSDQAGTEPIRLDVPSALLDTQFHRADLSATFTRDSASVEAGITAGTDTAALHGEVGSQALFGLNMARTLVAGRLSMKAGGEALQVRAGLDAEYQDANSSALGKVSDIPSRSFSVRRPRAQAVLSSLWLSAHSKLDAFETTAGVRAELYALLPGPASAGSTGNGAFFGAVDPRLEERLRISDTLAVRAGAGWFHQSPTVLIPLPVSEVSTLDQGLQWAAHLEAGADVRLPFDAELGVTGFYHPIFRSVEYRVDELVDPRRRVGEDTRGTSGRAYGAELFVRRTTGRLYGWVSATLQHSERREAVVRFDDRAQVVQGPFDAQVPFAFDQLFVLDVTVGVKLPRGFTAGLSFHFNTGRPESGDVSSRNQRAAVEPGTGWRWWVPQDADRVARLPPYARVDVRVAKLWTFDDLTLELYLDVFNASAGQEALGFTYRVSNPGPDAKLTKEPLGIPLILPMLGVKGRY